MKAVSEIAAGAALLTLDIVLPGAGVAIAPWVSSLLVGTASSLILGGIGDLLTKQGPGLVVPETSSIAPWQVVFGVARVGGCKLFEESSGSNDKYLHRIYVLAAHPCESVDLLLMDNQYVPLDSNGNSYNAPPRNNPIVSIVRSNDIVTVVISGTPGYYDGNLLQIENVTTDRTLNGIFAIQSVATNTFIYQCGGADVSISNQGNTRQTWPQYSNTIHCEFAYGNQTSSSPPFPGLLASGDTGSNGLWTNQHLLQGMTAVYVRLKYDQTIYANGIPTPSFIVRGKNNIYDHRSNSYGYTANSALCIADFLTNDIWGFRAEYGTTVPTAALIAAANICDESTPTASGFNEPRYECHGAFTTDADRGTVLQNMLSSCGGRLTDTGGQYAIQPAAWTYPTLNLGGTGTSPYRSVNGHELVDFGSSSSLYCQADWSCGAWVQLPPDNAGGCFISMCDAGSSDPTAAAPYIVLITGGPTNYQVEYIHDYGSGLIAGHEFLTFNDSSLLPDQWVYVGLSRDSTAKTVTLYTGDGTTVTNIQTLSYSHTPGISPGAAHFTLGAIYSDVTSTGSLEQTVLCMQNGYMSDTVWSSSDHSAAMAGSPTATGLLIDCDLTQASPVSVTTATGTLTPTVTGTTLVQGVGVQFLENATGPIKWSEKLQGRDLYNMVIGSFTSPINAWSMTQYPGYAQDADHGYSVDQNLLDDGGDRRYYSLDLPFTKSQSCAQRLAGIQLKRLRQQGQGSITAGLALYQCAALDTMFATLPVLGWNYKLLEVSGVQFVMSDSEDSAPTLGVQISIHETDPSVYEWSLTEEQRTVAVNPPTLPDQSSPEPATSVSVVSSPSTTLISADGVATPRILVTFTPPADGFVTAIEAQYQLVGSSTWITLPDVDPSLGQFYIDGVVIGDSYNIQLQAAGVSGALSGWMDVPGCPITCGGDNTNLAVTSIAVPSGSTQGQVLTVDSSGTFTSAPLPNATASVSGILTLDGDLTGVYATPVVAGLQGRSVSSTAPSGGQVLAWNGSEWLPSPQGNFHVSINSNELSLNGSLVSVDNLLVVNSISATGPISVV